MCEQRPVYGSAFHVKVGVQSLLMFLLNAGGNYRIRGRLIRGLLAPRRAGKLNELPLHPRQPGGQQLSELTRYFVHGLRPIDRE